MRRMGILASAVVAMMVFVGCKDDVASTPTKDGSLGSYSDKKNASLTADNIDTILSAVEAAMGDDPLAGARAAVSFDTSYQENGAKSGKMVYVSKITIDDETFVGNGFMKMSAYDYSDDGSIYLGGGLNATYSFTQTAMTMGFKGTLDFAGDFKGQIIYDLTMAMPMSEDLTLEPTITGTVKVVSGGQTIDLTDELLAAMNEEEVVEEDNTIVVNQ